MNGMFREIEENENGEVKTDCFGYKKFMNGAVGCLALEEMLCKKKECPFYKPKNELCKSCNKDRFHNCVNCMAARQRQGITTTN